jgi:hypothetical protein
MNKIREGSTPRNLALLLRRGQPGETGVRDVYRGYGRIRLALQQSAYALDATNGDAIVRFSTRDK